MGLTSSSWITTTAASPPVEGAAVTYHAGLAAVVLFGGFGSGTSEPSGSLWSFEQGSWRKVQSRTSPPARVAANLAYDAQRRVLVLFGGMSRVGTLLNDTWEWDGSEWTRRAPQGSPAPRSAACMVYDPDARRTVLFGGHGRDGRRDIWFDDTWSWDGSTWRQAMVISRPGPRAGAGLAHDAAKNGLVLFGGATEAQLSDTWQWDGGTWNQRSPEHLPPPRANAAMVFLDGSKVTLLFGGESPSASPPVQGWSDMWVWDGHDWAEVEMATSPGAGPSTMTAYDPVAESVVHLCTHVVKDAHPVPGRSPQPVSQSTTWLLPHV